MQLLPFRVVSIVIFAALLAALIGVIGLVVRDNASQLQSGDADSVLLVDRRSVTEAPVERAPDVEIPTTSTPTVASSPEIALDLPHRVAAGGFVFQPIREYELEFTDSSVNMSAPDADAAVGPTFVLIGGTEAQFIKNPDASLLDAFEQFVTFFAEEDSFQIENKIPLSTGTMTGMAADIASVERASLKSELPPFAGRLFMSRPNPPQFFVMVGIAPTDLWQQRVAAEFDAVLASVNLFNLEESPSVAGNAATPVGTVANGTQMPNFSTLTTSEEKFASESFSQASSEIDGPGDRNQLPFWHTFTNGNFVTKVAAHGDTVWAATTGGVVAWNIKQRTYTKYTTADGLRSNGATSMVACPIRGFGIVVGTQQGLQIFNLGQETWSFLHSGNSPMSFDDVADLYCDLENEFIVIGYQRHGLDIFDANANDWSHFDRNRALVSNRVEALTVLKNRTEIWVASDLGINVLENLLEVDNRRSSFYDSDNSPLQERSIDALNSTADGTVWIAQGDELFRIRPATQSVAGSTQREWLSFSRAGVDGSYPTAPIQAIVPATDETIWIGSEQGELCHFDSEASRCLQFFESRNRGGQPLAQGTLTHLAPNEDGGIYYSTFGSGISFFDGKQWQIFYLPNEVIKDNEIRDLVQDVRGNLWVASPRGVQSFVSQGSGDLQEIRNLFDQGQESESLLEQPIHDLYTGADGSVWFGSDSALRFHDGNWQNFTPAHGLVGGPVQSISVDQQGRSWLGTPVGLSILNEGVFFNLTAAEGLPSEDISVITADAVATVVWIGTNGGGLLRFEKNQLELLNQTTANLPSDRITALGFDADGSLLIGTDSGLARLVGGRAIKLRALGNASITAVATYELPHDNTVAEVWVGTKTSGVFHYDGFSWKQLDGEDKIPNLHITALLVDRDGTVWMGGAAGGLLQHIPLR